jgi:hypothetical protein
MWQYLNCRLLQSVPEFLCSLSPITVSTWISLFIVTYYSQYLNFSVHCHLLQSVPEFLCSLSPITVSTWISLFIVTYYSQYLNFSVHCHLLQSVPEFLCSLWPITVSTLHGAISSLIYIPSLFPSTPSPVSVTQVQYNRPNNPPTATSVSNRKSLSLTSEAAVARCLQCRFSSSCPEDLFIQITRIW